MPLVPSTPLQTSYVVVISPASSIPLLFESCPIFTVTPPLGHEVDAIVSAKIFNPSIPFVPGNPSEPLQTSYETEISEASNTLLLLASKPILTVTPPLVQLVEVTVDDKVFKPFEPITPSVPLHT